MAHFEVQYIGSVIFAVLTFLATLNIIRTRKINFLVRPSIICTMLLYFIYLLPSIIFNDQLLRISPAVHKASFLLSIVLFGAILGSVWLDKINDKLQRNIPPAIPFNESKLSKIILAVVSGILILVTGVYFYNVPFYNTGLYAILCEPKLYVILREQSLKLLSQKWLIYSYLIAFSCLCPLICTFIAQILLSHTTATKNKILWILIAIILVIFVTFFMLITGARVGVLNCILAVIGVLWMHLNKWKFTTSVILVLFIGFATPALISMSWVTRTNDQQESYLCMQTEENNKFLKDIQLAEEALSAEDKRKFEADVHAGFGTFLDGIIYRAFIIPAAVSGFYIEEAQQNGIGLNNFLPSKGKGLANKVAVNYGHRLYGPNHKSIDSATAPSTFVFFNYMYLGFFSIIISILGILAQDVIFFIAKASGKQISIPLMATSFYYAFIFAQTAYFTVLFTHGYLLLTLIIVIVFAISRHYNWKSFRMGSL